MKIKWNKKYTTIAVYSLIVIMLAVLFVVFVFKFDSFKSGFSWIGSVSAPLICGIVIAYIVNPLMMWIERTFFHKLVENPPPEKGIVMQKLAESKVGSTAVVRTLEKHGPSMEKKSRRRKIAARALSVTIAYIIVLAAVVGICVAVVPSVAKEDFFANNPEIANLISDSFTEIGSIVNKISEMVQPMAGDIMSSVSSGVFQFAAGLLTGLKNVVIGLIIAIYLLFSKERLLAQTKKILFAFLKNNICQRVFYVGSRTNSIFKSYVISNLVDALIIFVAMAIGCLVMGMPYPMLLAVVCGVTNLIPFFGPFIGAIPCGILILLVDPVKVIWFELFVLVLQQLDGNVIKPHLFGGSMGLPAIWVLVSITIGGGLFGIPGMLLGVPVFAVIYLLFAEFVSSRLKKKKMPEETREYAGDTSLFLDGYEDGSVSEEPALVREEKKGD
ncbi:MAG: AI-2E family transporter [Eubacterium sp.]|nr:AI-2E family transporter [Eubacterium sp.]